MPRFLTGWRSLIAILTALFMLVPGVAAGGDGYLTPEEPRRLNPRASRALGAVCMKALSKDPQLRYPSALELALDVRRYLEHLPVSAVELMDRACLRSIEDLDGLPAFMRSLSGGCAALLIETRAAEALARVELAYLIGPPAPLPSPVEPEEKP